ncbi:MAG: hypothetical protein EXS14_07435 [Planctomycetes bacterium]|nr:hypothetical protein [Planctomycetota bacterium]
MSEVVVTQRSRWRRRLLWLGACVALILLLRSSVCDVLLVVERSMWPTLEGGRDRVLLNRLATTPQRFEVWAYRCEADDGSTDTRIKRVVALPGETLALQAGDVFVGQSASALQRAQRTPELRESMRVTLPGPHVARPERWQVQQGSLQPMEQGAVLLRAENGAFKARILGSMGPGAESVMDDCIGSGGLVHPGRHVVPDTRLALRVFPVQGRLSVLHELADDVRGLVIEADRLSLHNKAGIATELARIPPTGLDVQVETLDGSFSISTGTDAQTRVCHESARDTVSGRSLSLWRVHCTAQEARLHPVDLSRDVHYFFGSGLGSLAAYQVGAESCFAVGDNQPISADSRMHGPVPYCRLLGRAERILLPRVRARSLN